MSISFSSSTALFYWLCQIPLLLQNWLLIICLLYHLRPQLHLSQTAWKQKKKGGFQTWFVSRTPLLNLSLFKMWIDSAERARWVLAWEHGLIPGGSVSAPQAEGGDELDECDLSKMNSWPVPFVYYRKKLTLISFQGEKRKELYKTTPQAMTEWQVRCASAGRSRPCQHWHPPY